VKFPASLDDKSMKLLHDALGLGTKGKKEEGKDEVKEECLLK